MISFSADIDWAADEVVAYTIELFEKYGVKCTFFSTHHTDVLTDSDKKLFEIGIHPNFNSLLSGNGKNADDVLDEMLESHPDAKGVRSHSMMQSSDLLQKFAERNLVYDANHFLPYCKGIKPFKLWTGMVRIPYNWEDDVHWAYGYSFDSCKIDLNDDGLNVFDFHPVHIFLNTENQHRYNEAKKYLNNPGKLLEYRNSAVKGTYDILVSLLEYVNKNGIQTKNLIEIASEFQSLSNL